MKCDVTVPGFALLLIGLQGCVCVDGGQFYMFSGTIVDEVTGTPAPGLTVGVQGDRRGAPDPERNPGYWAPGSIAVSGGKGEFEGGFEMSGWGQTLFLGFIPLPPYASKTPPVLERVIVYVKQPSGWKVIEKRLQASDQKRTDQNKRWVRLGTVEVPRDSNGARPDMRDAAVGVLEEASQREFGSGACEDTVGVARQAGLDYTADLDKAVQGDEAALRRLLVFTTYERLDAASSEGHAAVLGELLHTVGDTTFAKALRDQPAEVQRKVGVDLRYDLGLDEGPDVAKAKRDFQTRCPQTARIVLRVKGAQKG